MTTLVTSPVTAPFLRQVPRSESDEFHYSWTPLHCAARWGQRHILEQMIGYGGIPINIMVSRSGTWWSGVGWSGAGRGGAQVGWGQAGGSEGHCGRSGSGRGM